MQGDASPREFDGERGRVIPPVLLPRADGLIGDEPGTPSTPHVLAGFPSFRVALMNISDIGS